MIRPLDILVLLKLRLAQESSVRQLAESLHVPPASLQHSLQRLAQVKLIVCRDGKRRVNRLNTRDFLVHSIRWFVPTEPGALAYGFPTAHASPRMKPKFIADDDPYVIPANPDGHSAMIEGKSVAPMHPNVPRAIAEDAALLDLITLVDTFRVGRARDRQVAAAELQQCL